MRSAFASCFEGDRRSSRAAPVGLVSGEKRTNRPKWPWPERLLLPEEQLLRLCVTASLRRSSTLQAVSGQHPRPVFFLRAASSRRETRVHAKPVLAHWRSHRRSLVYTLHHSVLPTVLYQIGTPSAHAHPACSARSQAHVACDREVTALFFSRCSLKAKRSARVS